MVRILELSPVYSEAANPRFHFVQGIWNTREQAERVAIGHGHSYRRPDDGGVTLEQTDQLLDGADALILAPSLASASTMNQPLDGEAAGREIGRRLLDRITAQHPELHIVLASHFLVGHGVTHKNAKPNTWALRALEAHLRAGRNPWTVLRATWLSTVHDPSYQIRLTQDQNADGLVSTVSIAQAVVTAIESPAQSAGVTAAVFNLSIPQTGTTDLVAQFDSLEPDFESVHSSVPV
jgi:hypothetical protein